MEAVQTENLLLLSFPFAVGFVPAFLDALKVRSHIPNLVVALFVAVVVTMSSPAWITNMEIDHLIVVFGLLVVPGILISYLVTRLVLSAIVGIIRALVATGRS